MALLRIQVARAAGVEPLSPSIASATAPATTGVAALVPLKQFGAYAVLFTQAGAETSGLIRPSLVGPCEL